MNDLVRERAESGGIKDGVQRWTLGYPGLGSGPLPIESCISPQYFARERERIFRKVWLNVAREEEIPRVGDFLVKELPACATSLIVVRGTDGQVRAFHNMCSHRGNKVALDPHGSRRGFVCKFHGWTYDLEGRLRGVPDQGAFFDLCQADHGLTTVACQVWEGFIFVNLNPNSDSLHDYLGEFGQRLQGYPFGKLPLNWRYTAEVKCNWKVGVGAFLEQYHFKFIHSRTVAKAFLDETNPFGRLPWVKLGKRHNMSSNYFNAQHHPTPTEEISRRHGAVFHRNRLAAQLPSGMNPARASNWVLDSFLFFPEFFLQVHGDRYFVFHFWPIQVDRMMFEVSTYCEPAMNAGQRFSQECNKSMVRDTLLEDLSTLERIQTMLPSGAKDSLILSDSELRLRHLHRVVEDYVTGSVAAERTT